MLVRWLLPLLVVSLLPAQKKRGPGQTPPGHAPTKAPAGGRHIAEFPVPDVAPLDSAAATAKAVAGILALQEDGKQWPYEGVYREDRGNLPIGYRVGGSAITIMGLVAAPGYSTDKARRDAVGVAILFVLDTLEHDRMQIGFKGGYDVRGWGHVYALTCLLHLQDARLVPDDLRERVAEKTKWLVSALVETAIPDSGGWNYARRNGYKRPGNRASTFMTAPALQALFHAKARGYDVPDLVVEQALAALQRARSQQGGYAYGSAPGTDRNEVPDEKLGMMDKTPGSAARSAVCETTLMLAGRGDEQRHRAALELFFKHWDDLAVRKSRRGTHIKPYGIAPYYFMFGHLYCAQAIEQIKDRSVRAGFRTKMKKILAQSVEENGTWNDRQFPRSASYGTGMALLTLHMARLPKPHAWQPGGAHLKGGK